MMFAIAPNANVYVYTVHVDMRKSIDGLVALLVNVFQQNPQQGDVFVFTNKHHNKIKVLFWDRNGFVIYYKRLEKGRFHYSRYIQDDRIVVTTAQFKALLMGIDFYLLGHYPIEHYQDFF
jgi:transposase